MRPAEWFTITRNQIGASEFYLKSPFRFTYFQLVLTCFAVNMTLLSLIVTHFWDRLGTVAIALLAIAVWATLSLLALILKMHRFLHSLFTTGQIPRLELGSDLDKALSTCAIITNQGLLYVALAVSAYCVALFWVLFTR